MNALRMIYVIGGLDSPQPQLEVKEPYRCEHIEDGCVLGIEPHLFKCTCKDPQLMATEAME